MTTDATTARAFLASLSNIDNVNPQYEQLCGWASEGKTDLLYQIWLGLDEELSNTPEWAVRSLLEMIIRALALTPGRLQSNMVARLALRPQRSLMPGSKTSWSPWSASLLASGQPHHILLELVEQLSADESYSEFLLLLTHELVLRGVQGNQHPALLRHSERMARAGHPLARLPLTLLEPVERLVEDYLPSYSLRGHSLSLPFGPAVSAYPASVTIQGDPYQGTVYEITGQQERELLTACVLNWIRESNGRAEGRVFAIHPPLRPEQLSTAVVASLGTVELEGVAPQVTQTTLENIFTVLFAAAANGGAYNSGRYGACGRLEAWRSLAALAESDHSTSIPDVAQQATRCTWYQLDVARPWFEQVAWDIALIALRPNMRSLALLVATDTD